MDPDNSEQKINIADGDKELKSKKPKKENKILKKKDISLEIDFVFAVERLWSEFDGEDGLKKAKDALYPLIERNTVKRLFFKDKKLDDKYEKHKNPSEVDVDRFQKEKLVWYYGDGPERFVYRRVADTIRQDGSIKRSIINKSKGEYVYFRYYSDSSDDLENLKYVNGTIKIYDDGGIPKFSHWSHDHKIEEPEHSGPIFQGKEYLFFVGARKSVLRLAICDVPDDEGYMIGLVVSVRSTWPNDPFAARFVMVNVKQEKLVEELKNTKPNPNHGKEYKPGYLDKNKTLGEVKFFEMTDGSYAYFMLSKHKTIKL